MRALWKGSLSFGLVNIPVELYSGSKANEIKFTLLHKKDLSEIKYARICKDEGKEVPWDEIVKGFETEKGKYIIVTDEDLKKAALEKSPSIDIIQFTDENDIDTIFYEKPYVLTPDKNADKAYSLLVDVLKKSKKVGIARYVLHNREHIAVIKTYKNFIVMNQLRFEDELQLFENLKTPAVTKVTAQEIDIAIKLINHMTGTFKPEKYHDTYVQELKEILRKKGKGKKSASSGKAAQPAPGKVHDIMALLRASIEEKDEKVKKPKKTNKSRVSA